MWNNFFSDISEVSSKANVAIQLADVLQEKWKGKTVTEVLGDYKQFLNPEITKTEDGEEKRVKPWFLKFFSVGFSGGMEYNGFIYRYEYNKGIEDVEIAIDPFGSEALKFFNEFSSNADKALESAKEQEFDFSRTDVEATLSDSEEIREDLINLYEKMCNFLPMVNEKMRFLWSLSNGVLEDYAREVYPELDIDILKRLGFEVDPTYDMIYAPYSEKTSPVSMLMDMIKMLSKSLTERRTVYESRGSKKARDLLGIENSPASIIEEYYDKTVSDIRNKMSDWEREIIQNIVDRVKRYSGGDSYFHKKGKDEIDNLPRYSEHPKLETIEACSPLMLTGILQYNSNSKAIEGWNKVAERW